MSIIKKCRALTLGMAITLSAAFSNSAAAQEGISEQEKTWTVLPGSSEIKGSLSDLTPQEQKSLPAGTLKLIYFGTPWNGKCSIDLAIIKRVMESLGEEGKKITPVFVYAQYPNSSLGEAMINTYVRSPNSPFIGMSAPPNVILKIADNYGAKFWNSQTTRIFLENAQIEPTDHSRLTYLMSPDLTLNLRIFDVEPYIPAMEYVLREELKKLERGQLAPANAPAP